MIQVQCPSCQKRYSVPEVHAGKKMRCKQCSAVVSIPASPAAEAKPEPMIPVGEDTPALLRPAASPAAAQRSEPSAQEAEEAGAKIGRAEVAGGESAATEGETGSTEPAAEPAAGAATEKPKFGAKKFPKGKFPGRPLLKAAGAGGTGLKPAGAGGPRKVFGPKKPLGKKFGAAKPPLRKASLAKEADIGAEAGGELAGESTRWEADSHAAEVTKPDSKRLVIIGASAVGLLLIALGVWFFYFRGDGGTARGPGPKSSAAPAADTQKGKKVAAKEKDSETAELETSAEKAGDATGQGDLPAVETLAAVPGSANLLANVAFGRLVNVPAVRDAYTKWLASSTDSAGLLQEAEFDPLSHLRTVWIAVAAPSYLGEAAAGAAPPPEPPALVLVEGTFNRAKVLAALKSHSIIAEGKKEGPYEVFSLQAEQAKDARLAFVSEDLLAIGSEDLLAKTLALAKSAGASAGASVKDNETLKRLTGDFASTSIVWAALELPSADRKKLAEKAKAAAKSGPPLPEFVGGKLSIDLAEDESIRIEAEVECPTTEDVKKAQGFVGPFLLQLKMQAPPEIQKVASGVKLKPQGKSLTASLTISKEVQEELKGMALGALGVAPSAEEGQEDATKAESGAEEKAEEATEAAPEAGATEEKAEGAAEEKSDAKEAAPEESTQEKAEKAEEKVENPEEKAEKPDANGQEKAEDGAEKESEEKPAEPDAGEK